VIAFGFAFLLFLITGTLFTVWPKRVQKFIINACESGRWGFWIARSIILRRVKKPEYLIELRLIGIGCIWGAVVCAWILFAAKRS
jgi:hypothetical protein